MEFRLKEDEIYFREQEEYGIVYSNKNKSFFKISASSAQELKELKKQKEFTRILQISPVFDITKLKRIELIMSTACNLKCKYCFASGGNYNQKISNIKLSVLDKTIELIENANEIQEIVLFGGEPTLAEKEIEYLCSNLEKKGIQVKYKMVTNLYDISDHLIDLIHKYSIILTVSLDGPEQINNRNRIAHDGGNVYQNVLNNYLRLKTSGIKVKAIEATYTLSHKKAGITKEKLKAFFHNNFEVEDIYIVDDLNEKRNDLCQELEYSFQKTELDSSDYLFLTHYFLKNNKKCGICDSGVSSICIDPLGYIYPCHMYINKDCKYTMGNILSERLTKFEEIFKIREQLGCYSCSARYSCNICLANVLMNDLSIEKMCQTIKEKNESLIYEMYKYFDTNNLQNLKVR